MSRVGAWFRYGDLQLGQGREKAVLYLRERPELVQELKEKVLAACGLAAGKEEPVVTNSETKGPEVPQER